MCHTYASTRAAPSQAHGRTIDVILPCDTLLHVSCTCRCNMVVGEITQRVRRRPIMIHACSMEDKCGDRSGR